MDDARTMTEAEKTQFVLGVYFRTQAAIERYMGRENLSEWTEHVATINANAMKVRIPDKTDQAKDVLAGLASMLEVYGSDTSVSEDAEAVRLDVRQCGIYDYRERARDQGVQLTLHTPCEFCVDLHHRTAAQLGLTVENRLGERSCTWVSYLPKDGQDSPGDETPDSTV